MILDRSVSNLPTDPSCPLKMPSSHSRSLRHLPVYSRPIRKQSKLIVDHHFPGIVGAMKDNSSWLLRLPASLLSEIAFAK